MSGHWTTQPYKFERLDADKAILLIVDHQLGLLQLVKDYTTAEFRNNILAHAELGKLFNLPVVMTTSAETGPNGPLPKEITEMYPDAPFIKRNGEVNAWDNPDFRAAVEATGRRQIILGGIVTEVCTMFLALSLREAGYSVWANTEASGTATPKLAEDANRRMEGAGVHLTGLFGVSMFLMKDWRNTPGTEEVLPFLDKYFPAYGIVARAHGSAKQSGDIVPGELPLLG
ncbi:Isochorismatase hydrolase [Rhizodiscina lignyota]|uniref:Isochorismatase hydrolase n=1 Tax=Rhizodiscina lignyota TaxID=1504668 RepID=A0A9P4INK3_9PEZI|nr:Isochorismatase hydrolase [Rhizodiscina lignyota]